MLNTALAIFGLNDTEVEIFTKNFIFIITFVQHFYCYSVYFFPSPCCMPKYSVEKGSGKVEIVFSK